MKTRENSKEHLMEVQNQQVVPADEMERTRSRRNFIPRTDIYETDKEIVVLADIPGANEKTVDITLENNVLTISANIEPVVYKGLDLAYAEYEEGDYQRSFRLSGDIDRNKIDATVKDGVLQLHLQKSEAAKTRKIAVRPA
jgi:HSP20 family protein